LRLIRRYCYCAAIIRSHAVQGPEDADCLLIFTPYINT
jgi:hypothetical protein